VIKPTPTDDNVISTPLYDTSDTDPTDPDSRGPYYVPWKKTSMDLYNKIHRPDEDSSYWAETRYKSQDGYISGSTLGNVPTKNDNTKENSDDTTDKNDKK
jgi:hypothetical protein